MPYHQGVQLGVKIIISLWESMGDSAALLRDLLTFRVTTQNGISQLPYFLWSGAKMSFHFINKGIGAHSNVKDNVNTLRQRQNGRHFADDTFKPIFLNENIQILIKISLKFVPKVSINNNPALVQIMAWRRPGDKPLSEPMMVCLLTHICVTRPQWVK